MLERLIRLSACATAVTVAIGYSAWSGAPTFAQSRPATTVAPVALEVASVKRNESGDGRAFFGIQPGGRFTVTNVPLRQIIANAYEMQVFRIEGGPGWIGTDRFDIVAKAEGNVELNRERIGPLLREVLADRFKLQTHVESRELPVYALVLARGDGKLGPNATPAAVDCGAVFAARGRGGPAPAPPQPGERMQCGIRMTPGTMEVGGMPMSELVRALSQQVGRVVVDRTNLTGAFDVRLEFTPEFQGRGAPPDVPAGGPNVTDAPSLFTALQEQAGLKLESQRAPVEVLVIDKVEQPTED